MKLIIIGNEKVYRNRGLTKSNSYDLENILEAFKGFDVKLFCRKETNNLNTISIKFIELISF